MFSRRMTPVQSILWPVPSLLGLGQRHKALTSPTVGEDRHILVDFGATLGW
jgi:hypothetical protein